MLVTLLMVRRRVSAVSNHEATVRPHPSRRGEDAAPQDEEGDEAEVKQVSSDVWR
jgi:hypothetical protein